MEREKLGRHVHLIHNRCVTHSLGRWEDLTADQQEAFMLSGEHAFDLGFLEGCDSVVELLGGFDPREKTT